MVKIDPSQLLTLNNAMFYNRDNLFIPSEFSMSIFLDIFYCFKPTFESHLYQGTADQAVL